MALTTCKECDGKVSTLAKTCPHCGITKPAIKVNKKSFTIAKNSFTSFSINEKETKQRIKHPYHNLN